jgi:hypothetical protein
MKRITVAKDLPLTKTLESELGTFKVKITGAANETYEAWREGQHDDLVLAVAMAAWLGQRNQRVREFKPYVIPASGPRRLDIGAGLW